METTTEVVINFTNQSDYFPNTTETSVTVAQRVQDLLTEPLNIVLIIVSFIGLLINSLSIAATLHIPYGQTTHSKLIINLAISDICIILSVFLHVIVGVLSPLHKNEYCIEVANQRFLNFALLAIIINLLAMGIDHYIAILKPMHYHEIMSRSRGNVMLILIWIISLIGGLLDILVGAFNKENNDNFCLAVLKAKFHGMYVIFGLVLLELLVLIYLYLRIYLEIKNLLARGQTLHQDDMHNKKAIVTTLLIIGTFMICMAPNSLFQITIYILVQINREGLIKHRSTILVIHSILWILMLTNSLCDPIIYAIRLRDVRRGYRHMLLKLFKRNQFMNSSRQAPSGRSTGRFSISETDYNNHSGSGLLHAGNASPSKTPPDSNTDLKECSHNRASLLLDNNKNCNDDVCEFHFNKILVINMLDSDTTTDKYLTDNDETASEVTILTPLSDISNKATYFDIQDKKT